MLQCAKPSAPPKTLSYVLPGSGSRARTLAHKDFQRDSFTSSSTKSIRHGSGCLHTQDIRCKVASTTATARDVKVIKHVLSDGTYLEVLHQPCQDVRKSTTRPAVVFIHGVYHAAWCWQEHFMPYFAERGYDTYAVSLKGQGGSSRSEGLKVAGDLASHAADIGSFVSTLDRSPVLVGHSFGGLVVQRYVAAQPRGQDDSLPPVAGVACLASAPPTGNNGVVGRLFKKSFVMGVKITWAFVSKSWKRSATACRELFFSDDIDEQALHRYHALLVQCSPIRVLDVSTLKRDVPLGKPAQPLPAFVGGAMDDWVVDEQAVAELAAHFGTTPVLWPRLAHDVMLVRRPGCWDRWLSIHPENTL